MFIVAKIENNIYYLIKKDFKSSDKKLERNRVRYQKNREAILEQKKQRGICECGSKIRLSDKPSHIRSQKHIKLIKNIYV